MREKKESNYSMSNKIRMPFGKYKGDLIADVPSSYLTWTLDHAAENTLEPMLARALALELFQRLILPHVNIDLSDKINPRTQRPASDPHGVFDEPTRRRVTFKSGPEMRPTPPPSADDVDSDLARQVIDAGYHVVSLRVHPDAGGDAETFVRLSRSVEALRNLIPRRIR